VATNLDHVHHLVGVAEIAEMLGVTRQRVHQLMQLEGFPEPTAELSAGRIWLRTDVEKWARRTGRLPGA
jgi:predicted DNA-binding transcriptional regulator AlpA